MTTMLDAAINLKDNFSNTLEEVENNVKNFQKTTKDMAKEVWSTGKNISKVGGTLTKSLTLPLVGIGTAAIKIGMDFEQSMSNVKAVTGANAEEMEQLEKAARDAGKATSKSAKESADALGYMGLAGWDAKDSIEGLMPVLRLSEAGNIELARASSLVTDSMSAMGIEVKDLPKYLDTVAQASRSSNTDIDAMMEAYLGVGGVLRGLNVPIEDSAVSLGMLANAGIKGGEGGKSLSSILTNLTAPTGRAKKALDELGFSAFDSQGNFKGMEDVLFDLKGKMSGMTQEQKNSYMSMIAGKEHIKGLNALMNGLDDSYVDLKESIGDADGALDEMSKTMLDNNKGSLTQLKSGLEEVGLKIYDTLKPAIADAIDLMQRFTDKLNNLTPEQQETITKFVKLAVVIGPALMLIGKMTTGVGKALYKFSDFAGKLKKYGSILGLIKSPAFIVVASLTALAVAGILLYKNWDKIKAKVNQVFPNMKQTISTSIGHIKNIFNGLVQAITFVFKLLIPVFTGVWETVKNIFIVAVETIGGVIGGLLQAFSGIITFLEGVFTLNWSLAWQGIKDIFGGIFGGLVALAKAPLNLIIGLVNGVIGGLNKIKLPKWVPKIGGKGINVPLIPKLAKGTSNWQGGTVQVHERGGEIIDLPRGSRVYPHDESVAMARKEGKNGVLITGNTFNVREESDIDKIADALVRKLEKTELNMA